MNVRRLAAIDMYGTRGMPRRRRIITAEFILGAAGLPALGCWLISGASGPGGLLFGGWMIGAGLNYAPLAIHAITLSRPGRLGAELAGVDTGRELRRYGLLQFWIAVPLALIWFTVRHARRGEPAEAGEGSPADMRRPRPGGTGGVSQ